MKSTKSKMLMLLAAFMLAMFSVAQADTIVLVTAPQAGAFTVDWSQLGAAGAVLPHAFVAIGSNGDTATGSFATPTTNKGELVQQGTDWSGNFAAGEYAVWTTNHGPFTVSFGNSYNFVGAYVQQNTHGPFTMKLVLFNGSTVLGTVSESGVSDTNVGTAIFIGAKDKTGPNITKVIFEETSGTILKDFAVATLYYGAVPEPGTLVLLGSGLIGLASLARRRKSK